MNHGLCEDGRRARHRKAREFDGVDAGDLAELIVPAVVGEAVVEEGAEGGSTELETGVESGLNDDVDGVLKGEQQPGLHEKPQMLVGLRERGRIASC